MSQQNFPQQFYEWNDLSFQILSHSTRSWFAHQLDPQRDSFSPIHRRLQDWRGVAELLDYGSLDLDNFQRAQHPTLDLFRHWSIRPEATIGALLGAIKGIERYDILGEPQLLEILGRDINDYRQKELAKELKNQKIIPVQVDEVESSDATVDEFVNITVNEASTGIPEEFDAFVCYTRQDFGFVRDMLHRLETVHGLKLCIPDRDLMPGCATYVIMAKLIQERCRKMIIVLSPDYTNSDECRFQTLFAHSLAPGAQQKKLIPILYRQCAIPSILNYICLVDYTRCDVVDWFWQRLANSLKADRRSNQFSPLILPSNPARPLNSMSRGDLARSDSRSSFSSTQPIACTSGSNSSLNFEIISSDQRSYSNPSLNNCSGRDGFTTTSNLVIPETWNVEAIDVSCKQSIVGQKTSFEMEIVNTTSFIDIAASKTETLATDANKKSTTRLFTFPFSKKSKKN